MSAVHGITVNYGGRVVYLGPITVLIHAAPIRRPPVAPALRVELVGREMLLTELEQARSDQEPLVLVGPAGSGKTSVALAFATRRQAAGEYGGVFWIAPDPTASVLAVIRDLERQALPDTPPSSVDDPVVEAGRVRSRLSEFVRSDCGGRALVVVDMPEVVSDDHLRLVRGVLAAAPRKAHILIVTRSASPALRGRRMSVPPLEPDIAVALLSRHIRDPQHFSTAMRQTFVEAAGYLPQQIIEEAWRFNEHSESFVHPSDDAYAYIKTLAARWRSSRSHTTTKEHHP